MDGSARTGGALPYSELDVRALLDSHGERLYLYFWLMLGDELSAARALADTIIGALPDPGHRELFTVARRVCRQYQPVPAAPSAEAGVATLAAVTIVALRQLGGDAVAVPYDQIVPLATDAVLEGLREGIRSRVAVPAEAAPPDRPPDALRTGPRAVPCDRRPRPPRDPRRPRPTPRRSTSPPRQPRQPRRRHPRATTKTAIITHDPACRDKSDGRSRLSYRPRLPPTPRWPR